MQAQTQPFVRLMQANMDLLTRFLTSPQVKSQVPANSSLLFQQASEAAMKLMQSGAFADLFQGMLKNYTEFLTELSQSSMEMMSQGQASMTRQLQDAADHRRDRRSWATSTSGRVIGCSEVSG